MIHRAAAACLCAEIAAAALVVDADAYQQFSEIKALATYILGLLLVGLLVTLVLVEGRAAVRWSPLHIPVAVLGLTYVAASLFALDHRVALAGAEGRSLGLLSLLAMLTVYAGAASLVPKGTWVLRWIATTIAGVALVTAFVEVGQWLGAVPGVEAGRPLGLAGNADMLGALMASVAGGAFGVAAAPATGSAVRRWSAAIGALGIAAWLLTGTRTPLPGLVAVMAGLGILWVWSTPGARRVRLIALGTMAVVSIAAFALSPVGPRVARVVGSLERAVSRSDVFVLENAVVGRLDIYRVALEEFAARPVLGVGPDNYVAAYPAYRLPGTGDLHAGYEPQTSTHGWLFKTLTDSGAAGTIALIAVLVVGVGLGLRRWREPWVLGALTLLAAWALGSPFVPNSPATEWIPWISLGALAGMSSSPPRRVAAGRVAAPTPEPVPGRHQRRARRAGGRASGARRARLTILAPIAVSAVLALVPLRTWVASHDAADARGALATAGADATRAAVSNADRAVAGDPLRPAYWTLLGQAQHRSGTERDALDAYRRASELAPYDAATMADVALTEARVALARGKGGAADAVKTARRSVALDPHRPEVYFPLGYALYADGSHADAASAVETGAAFQDAEIPAYAFEVAARSYLATDEGPRAEDWARRGLAAAERDAGDTTAFHLLLAQVLAAEDKVKEALEEVDIVLRADPSNAAALELKADLGRPRRP